MTAPFPWPQTPGLSRGLVVRAGLCSAMLLPAGCASRQLVWGDVHGHTSLSDGKGSVAEYFTHARIELEFHINGHPMGEIVAIRGRPRIEVKLRGTDRITDVTVLRNGIPPWRIEPDQPTARLRVVDQEFDGDATYYVRVTQADQDAHGNPSRAWSSPIWVLRRGTDRDR